MTTGKPKFLILLGSVGGDSHSVGLMILKAAILARGWEVEFLGVQSKLEQFFERAKFVNVAMISCMDGHAWYYLQNFHNLKQKYDLTTDNPLWYLGGNLTVGDSIGRERQYYEMGFSQVFEKFVDVEVVMNMLERDLSFQEPKVLFGHHAPNRELMLDTQYLNPPPEEAKLERPSFLNVRNEVLEHWKTGADARVLDRNADFLAKQPSFALAQERTKRENGAILVQPRAGVALPHEQIRLFDAFRRIGVKTLSYQVDSLTRNNNYVLAEEVIRDARFSAQSNLNGFPVVNHGVGTLQRIISEVPVPMQVRHSTRDPRLLAEISFAGGVTAFEGGGICYNIPYYKTYPLEESIRSYQYVDRLAGIYHEDYGIVIDREYFGVLTGTLVPPCLAIVSCILEAILAAQQGVKSVSLGYAEQGNRVQDIAAIRMMSKMASEILANMGYEDISVYTVFNQFMAAFPSLPHLAQDLIYNSAITAALSGATRVMVKTPVEAYKIPSLMDNLEGINLVFDAVRKASRESINEDAIEAECTIIRNEVDAIIESVIQCGNGNIIRGIVRGFELGFIDIPFSPSIYNAGQVITARDCDGAVRFISTGNLQFGSDLKAFHASKIAERRRKERIQREELSYQLVEMDVLQVARGQYEQWPL